MDLREVPLVADVSGEDDRGAARLCMLGVSTRVPLSWLPIELEAPRSGDMEKLPDDGDSFRGEVNTLSDRGRLEGAQRVLKSRVDPLENGLERIVAGGPLGATDGREGAIEGGALGVNEGREGATERGALGVNDGLEGAAAGGGLNDGLEGAIEGDLPELNGVPWLRDGPGLGLGLGLGLTAWRLAAMSWSTALRSEPARAAITPGVACRRLNEPRPASEKPALYGSGILPSPCAGELSQDCARREPDDPISRAAASTADTTDALRSFLSPMANMAASFPSPAARDSASPFRRRRPTWPIVGFHYIMILESR